MASVIFCVYQPNMPSRVDDLFQNVGRDSGQVFRLVSSFIRVAFTNLSAAFAGTGNEDERTGEVSGSRSV